MTNGIDVAIVIAGLLAILVLFLYLEWSRWDEQRREDRQLEREARASVRAVRDWFPDSSSE